MSAERREQLIRRMCELMGWDYKTSPVWTGLRKVALAEAVPIGLDKLQEVVDRLATINPHQQLTGHELTEAVYQAKEESLRQKLRAKTLEKISEASDAAWRERVAEAVYSLDRLADLLADSEDLSIKQTGAVAAIHRIMDGLQSG